MKKRVPISLLLLLSVISFSSCNYVFEPKRDDIVYCEIVGDLFHTQYWDKNDQWDLKNMQLVLHYENGEEDYISATTKNATYIFDPASPEGLDHSVDSFRLVEGVYKDYRGNAHPIIGREFYRIVIVDYPANKSDSTLTALIFMAMLALPLCVLFISFLKKKIQN